MPVGHEILHLTDPERLISTELSACPWSSAAVCLLDVFVAGLVGSGPEACKADGPRGVSVSRRRGIGFQVDDVDGLAEGLRGRWLRFDRAGLTSIRPDHIGLEAPGGTRIEFHRK